VRADLLSLKASVFFLYTCYVQGLLYLLPERLFFGEGGARWRCGGSSVLH
jgi:hypothetical protein